jgi:hypothetical protein
VSQKTKSISTTGRSSAIPTRRHLTARPAGRKPTKPIVPCQSPCVCSRVMPRPKAQSNLRGSSPRPYQKRSPSCKQTVLFSILCCTSLRMPAQKGVYHTCASSRRKSVSGSLCCCQTCVVWLVSAAQTRGFRPAIDSEADRLDVSRTAIRRRKPLAALGSVDASQSPSRVPTRR